MTLLARFTPFFSPAVGWIVIFVVIVGLLIEMSGRVTRDIKKSMKPNTPARLFLGLRLCMYGGGLAMGIGLLREDSATTYGGAGIGMTALVLVSLISVAFRNRDPFSEE